MRAILFCREPAHVRFEGRTRRSLAAAGVTCIINAPDWNCAVVQMRAANEPLLLIASGAWFTTDAALPLVPSSATGKPLIAFGATRATPIATWRDEAESEAWTEWQRRTGGSFRRSLWRTPPLPEPACVYLEPAAARALAALALKSAQLSWAISQLADMQCRAARLAELDVYFEPRLRIVQLVTTIQIGGAERVTLDLAGELRQLGHAVCVAAWGKPTRLAFPAPANFADLSHLPVDPEQRATSVANLCGSFGADLVHAHLIRAREAQAIRSRGLPLVMTIHNMPQSWPPGLAEAGGATADLLLACSGTVAAAAETVISEIPIRTVWNGIDPSSAGSTPDRMASGAALREQFGIAENAFVLAALANPRRQKRLDRLPEILVELQRQLGDRRIAHLLLAGAPAVGNRDAEEAIAALDQAVDAAGVRSVIQWTGPALDIAPILAASDALVSVSEFEGLSLAHLEGLVAGLDVVATEVGGTAEIARAGRGNAAAPRLHLLAPNASAADVASTLARIAAEPNRARESTLPKSFTRRRMALRYADFYAHAVERARHRESHCDGEGLWLVTNNFSTGGAQSSARRLLLGLSNRGIKVRAAVVQEQPNGPTVGRSALLARGIPVAALPPPGEIEAEKAVAQLLARIAEDRPRAVVFWNLLTSYKLLLADGLLDIPVFDVSPGEMYFESLAAYFAAPRVGLPYLSPRDYGRRLSGFIVKYAGEAARAETCLGITARVIRNGVPVFPRAVEAKLRRLSDRLVFGTAARLAPHKRIEDLLCAFRLASDHLPPCVLRIAGGPETGQSEYADTLRKLAEGLPVEWCGELRDTSAFLRDLDVFVMISEPAGCPNASLEAMAAGLPIVATDVGGASEQVIDGYNGRLTPPRDAAALAAALIDSARSPERRAEWGSNSREHVRSRFSLEKMLDGYIATLGLGEDADSVAGGCSRDGSTDSSSAEEQNSVLYGEGVCGNVGGIG